eukprot:scpid72982/ scgid21052/ 
MSGISRLYQLTEVPSKWLRNPLDNFRNCNETNGMAEVGESQGSFADHGIGSGLNCNPSALRNVGDVHGKSRKRKSYNKETRVDDALGKHSADTRHALGRLLA